MEGNDTGCFIQRVGFFQIANSPFECQLFVEWNVHLLLVGFFLFFYTYIIPFSDNANYFAELWDATVRQIKKNCCHLYVHIDGCTSAAFSLGWVGGVWGVFSFLAPFLTLLWRTAPWNKLKVVTVCHIPLAPVTVIPNSHPPWAEMSLELLWLASSEEVTVLFLTANVGERRNKSRDEGEKPACNSGRLCFVWT